MKKHGSLYGYSCSEYKGGDALISIICQEHGFFEIKARSHIQGSGCKKCGQLRRTEGRRRVANEKIASGKKECRRCGKIKPRSDFASTKDKYDGKVSHCKKCVSKKFKKGWSEGKGRNAVYMKKFGISLDDYDSMLSFQGGSCAICKTKDPVGHGRKNKRFSVDHDHKTGKVRGLLCHHCNVGIGSMMDDVKILKSAIRYLEENK